MRLIDADALLEYLDKRRTYEVMDGRNKAYGKGVRDAMKDIESAPTIDAIPMEWITEKIQDVLNKDKALSAAAWLVMHAWRNEQEAR